MHLRASQVLRATLSEVATFSPLRKPDPKHEPHQTHLRVVIIEDSSFLLSFYRIRLSVLRGIDIRNSRPIDTIKEAMRIVGKELPSVVLLDLSLTPNNAEGFEILKLIKEAYPWMTVVLTTAIYSPENTDPVNERIRKEKFDAIFHKLDMSHLLLYLTSLLHQ